MKWPPIHLVSVSHGASRSIHREANFACLLLLAAIALGACFGTRTECVGEEGLAVHVLHDASDDCGDCVRISLQLPTADGVFSAVSARPDFEIANCDIDAVMVYQDGFVIGLTHDGERRFRNFRESEPRYGERDAIALLRAAFLSVNESYPIYLSDVGRQLVVPVLNPNVRFVEDMEKLASRANVTMTTRTSRILKDPNAHLISPEIRNFLEASRRRAEFGIPSDQ